MNTLILPALLRRTAALAEAGALTPQAIEKIRSSFKMDAHTRAVHNSITNNDLTELAVNREILRWHNEIFSHKIEAKGNDGLWSLYDSWFDTNVYSIIKRKHVPERVLKILEQPTIALPPWDPMFSFVQ